MDQLLVFLTSPIKRQHKPVETPPATAGAAEWKPAAVGIPRSWSRAAGYAFALLGLMDLGLGWNHYRQSRTEAALPKSALRQGTTFAMPEQIGNWKRLNTEVPPLQKIETRGVFSQIWHYRSGDTLASLAIDYPFQGYHDVTLCYTLRGWDVLEQRARGKRATNASPPSVEVRMQNHLGLHGALWFCAVDEHGRWLAGPGLNPSLKDSFLERFKLASLGDSVTYQVQVLSTGFNPLSPLEQEQVRQFFEEARVILWRQLFEQMRRKP
jgi:hypothetical protein